MFDAGEHVFLSLRLQPSSCIYEVYEDGGRETGMASTARCLAFIGRGSCPYGRDSIFMGWFAALVFYGLSDSTGLQCYRCDGEENLFGYVIGR